MSSYAKYCQEQATACARRARLASSPEMVAYCRRLEFRWLRLAEQAHETGGALGHESLLTPTLFPLHDKPAAYPAEYAKRAGELIARSARSLHQTHEINKRTTRCRDAWSLLSSGRVASARLPPWPGGGCYKEEETDEALS